MNETVKRNIEQAAKNITNRHVYGRPRQYHYDEVLGSICLLRSRNISWKDINTILKECGMNTSYRCLIHWKNETMRDVIAF